MARSNHAYKRFDQINMIPFIDIMLVMLAIVLTTASFVSKGILPINLPEATSELRSQAGRVTVTISVNADGQWYIDGQPRSFDAIQQMLPALKAADGSRSAVVLEMDQGARFGQFFELYDILRKLQFTEIQLSATAASALPTSP